ncbi:MAG: cyclic nucleotide-binding domain-containing protein [Deltaproteobacteria bacterium]|nr:cyclic nucleotide-binding domain-containing protein [Deltaproteobacteria bacterium]
MLEEIIKNPKLNKYLTSFNIGQTLFLEGDDSQDLFILISGQLDILKGTTKIAEITEKGALFGEMSFFLGARRTATVKAKDDVKAIRVPKEEITSFLQEFPPVGSKIATLLAQRLEETSQIVYGLREFSDQLPDAVIMTDREGKILTWNTSAERLYGREADQMRHKPAEEIYEEPQVYKDFLEEVQSKHAVREKVLKIKHPEKGTRHISTSTTVLYDGHHNLQGVLSLGRDVTDSQKLQRRYERFRKWLIPSLILLVLLTTGVFYGYAKVIRSYETMDVKKQGLRDHIAKDYLVLKSLLIDHFAAGDRVKTSHVMRDFFNIQDKKTIPYTGLVLLGKDKKVFNAYSIKAGTDVSKMIGSSYTGIAFSGSEESLHRVLALYRTDKDHPMGCRCIELAFEMSKDDDFLGWVAFQMDMDLLKRKYGIEEHDFRRFQFKKP